MRDSIAGRRAASGRRRRSATTIVGVGASAGGLKALQQFVAAIPSDSSMAYVVIMHLDPARESRVAELLQDRTLSRVVQVTGPTVVEGNHVYVIPPDRDLEMLARTIGVRERSERSERAPIDLFFRTLAEVAGHEAIGVVLSGTGEDGAAGIRSIREAGGITVAQLPEEAEYDAMPSNAIATGRVDLVLPSSRIPGELLRLTQRRPMLGLEEASGRDVETDLAPIFAALRSRTGHDFSMYKRSTVLRRLDRRLVFNGMEALPEYVSLLRASEEESQALLRDLLISVSAFFRDPEEFEALAAVLPALFEGKGAKDTVRVWVVGCATGEEVYSIAIVLAEHAATLEDPPRIQLFATDIDEKGYAWGREGIYPAAAVARIAPERLKRFFTKEPGGFRISKSLRELVLFAVHNVLRDPPFARIDLISCRNLFIYLQPDAQQNVLETFHYALNPDGFLFLGASESPGDQGLFSVARPGSDRIFRRNAMTHRVLPRLSAEDPRPQRAPARPDAGRTVENVEANERTRIPFSYGAQHVRMVEQYAQPSMIVDGWLQVVHLSDGAGRYLRLGEGEPSRRLLDLTRGDLRTALRTALHQAFENGISTIRQVRVDLGGTEHQIRVHVRPGAEDGGSSRFALVLFEDEGGALAVTPEEPRAENDRQDVEDLEEELRRTRAELESTSAAYDRTVADLQALNEELLSTNEEQKAATEELETGREEIQAINEELTTINQEHQSTIEELKRTNADLQNLIESTEIGTIFVDREMRIRRFTPAVISLFNFAPTDQGRPLGDITHRLHYSDLPGDVDRVLTSLERIEREVASENGESFIVRINPYRSHDGHVDGAVLTFFDHTQQHRIRQELLEAKTVAEAANVAKGAFLSTLSHELRTPLSAVLGYAEILPIGGTLTAEQEERVERIKIGARHLVSMIDELLNFARLDGGMEVVDAQIVDARAIAADVHVLMDRLADGKGLTFDVETPDDSVELTTDAGKVRQILLNLCGNAVKYTDSGGIRLRLRDGDNRVVFEVSDTGIGIAPEHHALIFDRFWQVDSSATRLVGGMGIGLAAAREYARLLGGDIEVESAVGAGSTFRLSLPGEE